MEQIKFEYGFESVNGIVKKKYYLHEIPFIAEKCDVWNVLPLVYVRQFIGVKGYVGDYEKRHENEVDLFEGDIVEAMNNGYKGTFVIKFRNESAPTFILFPAWQNREFWNIHASDLGREKGNYFDDLKKIGNIHENPELFNPRP